MLDLTGENLSTYLLREIRDLVNRNPRFRNLGGDTTVHTNTMVAWGDLRVTIDAINSQGTRMSSDYFLCTHYGRSVLCKLENQDGLFIEWVQELHNSSINLESGVYYFNVDSVDESTREVGLTIQKYKWQSATSAFAVGSKVYFTPGIDVSRVTPIDSTIQFAVEGNRLAILSFTSDFLTLQLNTTPLTPMTDFWYLRTVVETLTTSTVLGVQDITLPITVFETVSITDQDGYTLVDGVDYIFVNNGTAIRTSEWTPAKAQLTAVFTVKADPTTTLSADPENNINIGGITPGQNLAPGQTVLYNSAGNAYNDSDFINYNGQIWLKSLLQTGELYKWSAKVDEGQTAVVAHKMATNRDLIPGLAISIGDQVFVGDQCAILVSPVNSETYEVYGAKDNVSFDITVKANDRMTASEIAETIKAFLLVTGRDSMESAGLSIFEVSKNSATGERDSSATAPTTTYTLGVAAAADWELHVPLVTTIAQFSVDVESDTPITDFPGKLSLAPRLTAFGSSQFLPYYS
jgi:hypothetical protein